MKLFFLLLLPFSVNISIAQSHNTKCVQCKYSKKEKATKPANSIAAGGSDECTCRACNKKEEEETKAREAEQKRLQEVMVKRNQAARKEKLKKLKAETEKNKSTEVVIVNNPSPTKIVTKPDKEKSVTSLRFMTANSPRFFDPDTRESLECPENSSNRRIIRETFGAGRIAGTNIAEFLHPPETGVIQYYSYPRIYCNGSEVGLWDIIDYECNALFNDKNIHYIEHFHENWILIGYLPCDKYEPIYFSKYFTELKLYNVKTGKYYPIQIETKDHFNTTDARYFQ